MYAIVRGGGQQHKVGVGDVVEVDKVAANAGEQVRLPAVLLVDEGRVTSSPDALAAASVTAEVLGEAKGPKVTIVKFKNKTGYRRRQGHRQKNTRVKVTDISA